VELSKCVISYGASEKGVLETKKNAETVHFPVAAQKRVTL